MRQMPISKRTSRSSRSQLVRRFDLRTIYRHGLTGFIELELDEEGTRISLTIVDTPGFGDLIDNEARYDRQTGAGAQNDY